MTLLIAGLVLFLGMHSIRIFAPSLRELLLQRLGIGLWKGLYSLLSLLGLAMIAWGFDAAREHPFMLWMPVRSLRHLAAAVMLPAFMLWAAAYLPGNALKARVRHPLVLGVVFWAFGHLLVGGMLAHLWLFGSFLLWAGGLYIVLLRRDLRDNVVPVASRRASTWMTLALGVCAWALFAFGLHGLLIGIKPLG